MQSRKLYFLWDYDLDEETFKEIIHGKKKIGSLDQDWGAVRLLEYAAYKDIVHFIGFHHLVQNWSKWRMRVRSESRKLGLDWLTEWLPKNHPEKCLPE